MTLPRAVLLCWDGASWEILNPLVDTGKMPNLSALIDNGVMGRLPGLPPLERAVLATTCVTGCPADKHGVLSDIEPNPVTGRARLASSRRRQVAALWNRIDAAGLRSAVVGWPATQPVEAVQGAIVSDVFFEPTGPHGDRWLLAPDAVQATGAVRELAECRVHPGELSGHDLSPFVPGWRTVDQARDTRLIQLAVPLARAIGVNAAACWLVEHHPAEFTAVHYDLVGDLWPVFLPSAPEPLWSGVLPAAWGVLDAMLGHVMKLAGEQCTFLIYSGRHFTENGIEPDGMFCLSGPSTPHDEWLDGAELIDLAPTVLSLLGIGGEDELPGRALCGGPPQSGSTREAAASVQMAESWQAGDAIAELERLGYRDPAAGHPFGIAATGRWMVNYGVAAQSAGRSLEAGAMFAELERASGEPAYHALASQAWLAAARDAVAGRKAQSALGQEVPVTGAARPVRVWHVDPAGWRVRKPRLEEWPAARRLLPRAFDGLEPECLLAVIDEPPFVLGAVAWQRDIDCVGPVLVHVMESARCRGLGSKMLDLVIAEAVELGATRVTSVLKPGDSPHAGSFLLRHGFERRQRLLRCEGKLGDLIQDLTALRDRLRRSGREPRAARVVAAREAEGEPLEALLDVFPGFAGTPGGVRLRSLLPHLGEHALVLISEGQPSAAVLSTVNGDRVRIEAWVVNPNHRRRRESALLPLEVLDRLWAAGGRWLSFDIAEDNREMRAFVRRPCFTVSEGSSSWVRGLRSEASPAS